MYSFLQQVANLLQTAENPHTCCWITSWCCLRLVLAKITWTNQSISSGRRTISCKTGPFCNVSPSCCRLNWISEKLKTACCCLRRLFLKVYTELARCERIWLLSASANHLDQDYHTSNFWCKAALSPEHTSKQNNQTKWAITQIAFNQAAAHLRANCLLPSCCRQLQGQLDRSCKSAENTKVLDTSGRLTWKCLCN